MKFSSILCILGIVATVACDSKQGDTHYDRRKTVSLEADLSFECQGAKYIAEVTIKNNLEVDIKINAFETGLKTPPHQKSFRIERLGNENMVIGYKGKTVNKDGIDTTNELVMIQSGQNLSFKYNLSKYHGISPLDNNSYLVKYEVGATSDKGPIVIFIDSKQYELDSKSCTKGDRSIFW